jgi:uncharacterized protein (TIGR02246 family)
VRKTCLLAVSLSFIVATSCPALADESAARKMIDEYAAAFNKHDLEGVAGFWTEHGVHIDDESGERTEGREAIMADIAANFRESPDSRLAGRIRHLRLIKPDVASVEGEATVSSPGMEPSIVQFFAVLVDQNGKWMIDSIEESPIPVPATSYDALRDLEWLVGHWVDDSAEARVDTQFRWTADRAFLLRSYSIQTEEGDLQQGTQVIGWDPRSEEIRSWSFNSDGSFGDATWSKNGDDWLIKSSQTLPDGQAASGTFVLSKVDDNTMTMQLIGHEIEGEPRPASEPVTVVRDNADVPGAAMPSNQQ